MTPPARWAHLMKKPADLHSSLRSLAVWPSPFRGGKASRARFWAPGLSGSPERGTVESRRGETEGLFLSPFLNQTPLSFAILVQGKPKCTANHETR